VDLASLTSYDLSIPQAWGLAIQRHPANFEGIKFKSRFTNRPCLALFERYNIKSSLSEKLVGSLSEIEPALAWLDKFKIQLV